MNEKNEKRRVAPPPKKTGQAGRTARGRRGRRSRGGPCVALLSRPGQERGRMWENVGEVGALAGRGFPSRRALSQLSHPRQAREGVTHVIARGPRETAFPDRSDHRSDDRGAAAALIGDSDLSLSNSALPNNSTRANA
jgi:hypothetical protein